MGKITRKKKKNGTVLQLQKSNVTIVLYVVAWGLIFGHGLDFEKIIEELQVSNPMRLMKIIFKVSAFIKNLNAFKLSYFKRDFVKKWDRYGIFFLIGGNRRGVFSWNVLLKTISSFLNMNQQMKMHNHFSFCLLISDACS